MPTFAVIREWGPSWDRDRSMKEQPGWAEHAAFMDELAGSGFVVLGGPLGDGPFVLLIVDAASSDEIRARLAADPWPPELLSLRSIRPWDVRLRAATT